MGEKWSEKKQSPRTLGLCFFPDHFSPMSGTLFFSELKFLDSSLRYFLHSENVQNYFCMGSSVGQLGATPRSFCVH